MRKRAAAAVVALALGLSILFAGTAAATPVAGAASTVQFAASQQTIKPSVTWRWWGMEANLSKEQTKLFFEGAGLVLSIYPELKWVQVAGGSAGIAGPRVVDAKNSCLRFKIPWAGLSPEVVLYGGTWRRASLESYKCP
jgi:hypothetical protein